MYVEIVVDPEDVLSELSTDELIKELEKRGNDYNTQYIDADEARQLLETIWLLKREGKDYNKALDQLIYYVLGKIV